jgi:general secretion pathway protein C
MPRVVEKYFKLVTLVFVLLSAYLLAQFSSVLISKSLLAPDRAPLSAATANINQTTNERVGDYQIITTRNLFNANPKTNSPAPLSEAKIDTQDNLALDTAKSFDGYLVATGVKKEGRSFALIMIENKTAIYHIGDELNAGTVLVEVKSDRVFIKRGGKREELLLFVEHPGKKRGRTKRPPTRRKTKATKKNAASSQSETIKQVTPDSWVIDRREIDKAMGNLSQLVTQVRIVPNLVDGQAQGFKIFSIRPGSLFAKVGLKNGDVIKEVNGKTLAGIDDAYKAFSTLQGESSIQLNLLRRSQPKTLSYQIR